MRGSFVVMKLSTAVTLSILIAFGGYFGGNYLTDLMFPEENDEDESDKPSLLDLIFQGRVYDD